MSWPRSRLASHHQGPTFKLNFHRQDSTFKLDFHHQGPTLITHFVKMVDLYWGLTQAVHLFEIYMIETTLIILPCVIKKIYWHHTTGAKLIIGCIWMLDGMFNRKFQGIFNSMFNKMINGIGSFMRAWIESFAIAFTEG